MLYCLYSPHLCHRERFAGSDFCLDHILSETAEDGNNKSSSSSSSSDFKQCSFHMKSHRRCQRPAPKADKKDGFCLHHSRQALVARQRRRAPHSSLTGLKRGFPGGIGVSGASSAAAAAAPLLEQLKHYKKPKIEKKENEEDDKTGVAAAQPKPKELYDVFCGSSSSVLPSASSFAFDLSDPDESDTEDGTAPSVENSWRGDGDSDAESVDTDMDDPLKHAGAYTAEEVIRVMRDKLIRLQKLYIDQFQRLQYLLKEEKRSYKQNVRKEKEEQFMSIHKQPKDSPEEQSAYESIKSLNHYNKPHGQELVLYQQFMEKRVRAGQQQQQQNQNHHQGASSQNSNEKDSAKSPFSKCTFNLTTNTKCGDICIPLSKYCVKHIMSDTTQVLFRKCAVSTTDDDGPCETPIPDMLDSSSCVYHTLIVPSLIDNKEVELPPELARFKMEQKLLKEAPKKEAFDEPPQRIVLPAMAMNRHQKR